MCVGVQGDREKEIGLTVSPLMDRRHKGGITRSQVRRPTMLRQTSCLVLSVLRRKSVSQHHEWYDGTVRECQQIYGMSVLLQMGFFTIVGLPMFKAMADVFEGAKPMLEGVMGNYRAWEAAAAAAESST